MRKRKVQNRIWRSGGRSKRLYGGAAALLFCALLSFAGEREQMWKKEFDIQEEVAGKVQEEAFSLYLPAVSFSGVPEGREGEGVFVSDFFRKRLPLYAWAEQEKSRRSQAAEAKESSPGKERKPERMETLEPGIDMIEAVKRENAAADFSGEANAELQNEPLQAGEFKETQRVQKLDRAAYQDFDALVSQFYAVDSTTYIGRDQLDIDKLIGKDMSLQQKDASKPQILIYHTHSQEGFLDSVPGDDNTTIMGVGEYLAEILRREYGFHVIHHLGKYDVESRDYAYSAAAPALEQLLAENPDIEVVIDLHRDEMPADKRLVTEIDGRETARLMFFNGLSRTSKTGEIAYLQNPRLDANLAFSFQMQLAAQEYYPGLTRKIYLKGYRYNMQYRDKTLLIELGAQNNTVAEAMNACGPLAHILSLVLSGQEPAQ